MSFVTQKQWFCLPTEVSFRNVFRTQDVAAATLGGGGRSRFLCLPRKKTMCLPVAVPASPSLNLNNRRRPCSVHWRLHIPAGATSTPSRGSFIGIALNLD